MSSMIRPAAPPTEVEIPYDLAMPAQTDQPVAGLPAVAPGQLVELSDGQQVLILTLSTAAGAEPVARALRVCWPRHNVLPLGEVFELQPSDPLTQGTLRILGAWYAPNGVPRSERVLLEAIRRGFITSRTCGVPWPMTATWQLSEQASEQIEKYLFEVARTTGCAFPFHDIALAMRQMHLRLSHENPALCDIVTGEVLGRLPRTDDEMLGIWARELQRRVHSSEITVAGLPARD